MSLATFCFCMLRLHDVKEKTRNVCKKEGALNCLVFDWLVCVFSAVFVFLVLFFLVCLFLCYFAGPCQFLFDFV